MSGTDKDSRSLLSELAVRLSGLSGIDKDRIAGIACDWQ
jgi:hypothetical protein